MNNLSEKENIDNENFSNLDVELQSKCLSFFHFNINSFSKNVDNFDFDHLINELKLEFDILGILESRILKRFLNTNVSLQNYVIEQTSTESTAGVALLCINERPSRNLVIYKAKKLESIFAEVVLSKKINLIIEYIYKHPCMDIYTFIYHYFNPLLDNLSKEANKIFSLLGDFNIGLLNLYTSEHLSTFLDYLAPNSLQTLILLPTRISNNSKTLTDDFFCNIPNTVVKVQSLQTSHQVYRFIFHIIFHYQNSFQIPLQLNITLYLMTWENLITSHFLKILKKLIGIKSFN